MKNLKNYLAIVTLVSVLGVGSAFGQGSPPPTVTMSSLLTGAYNYFAGLLVSETSRGTNDQGSIPPSKK